MRTLKNTFIPTLWKIILSFIVTKYTNTGKTKEKLLLLLLLRAKKSE